jgi:hypothetical protein
MSLAMESLFNRPRGKVWSTAGDFHVPTASTVDINSESIDERRS